MDTMICTYVSEISEIVVKLKNKTMQNVCHEQEHKKGWKSADSS